MTDEQIIKALECCASSYDGDACNGCPFNDNTCDEDSNALSKYALELIKQQKADIKDLIKQRDEQLRINRQVVRRNGKHVDERNRLKSKLEKEVDLNRELFEKMAKDEAEIERLEADREALINGQITLQKMYAEAIKEFAEEFEKRCIASGIYPAITKDLLKNLVKEKTEGSNDK